jgi:uncharacterized protein (DUF2147 family)
MISIRAIVLTVALPLLATAPVAAEGDGILGLWNTVPNDYGYARIEITEDNERYHGRVVWLSEPVYAADDERGMGGKSRVDRENPDPELRGRPIIGIRLLADFEYTGKDHWKRGTIYDPQNGKTYKCNIKLQDDGTLKVRGYIGMSLLGRTTLWRRAEVQAR